MRTGSKVILGVLAGVAVGTLVGVLMAPDKGTATRKKISKKGKMFTKDLESKMDDFLEALTEKFDTVKENAGPYVEKGRGYVEKGMEMGKEKYSTLKDEVKRYM